MRNPDITLPADPPAGCCVIMGNRLMLTARNKGIPFGVASERRPGSSKPNTVGIVVRLEDRERMLEAIKAKEAARGRKKPKS